MFFKKKDTKPSFEWVSSLDKALQQLEDRVHDIEHSGVATAINKLNKEVFGDRKESESTEAGIFGHFDLARAMGIPKEALQQPTLRGQVTAIIEHLNLNFDITPKKVVESKVVAKKVSTKKRGRR